MNAIYPLLDMETETENQIQIGNGIAVSKNDIENRRFRHNT